MSNPPVVSVVMPTHNYGTFLGDAIDSILNQTYTDLELIVIDDASTDGTSEVLMHYSDQRLRVIKRDECSCSGAAVRNDGLRAATGTFIAVADADDMSEPDRLEAQVSKMQEDVSIDLLGGGMTEVDERGRMIGKAESRPAYEEWEMEKYRSEMLSYKNVVIHGTLLFRKAILGKLEGYRHFVSSGDTEFVLRASRYFRIYNLDRTLIKRRKHSRSVTALHGERLRRYHYSIFLYQEYLWSQKEAEKIQNLL